MATKICPSNLKQRAASTCLCSPTNHPGSFRCSRHRSIKRSQNRPQTQGARSKASSYWESVAVSKSSSLKAFFLQIIKPACHDFQRRRNFQPKPSRFSLMNRSGDDLAVPPVS